MAAESHNCQNDGVIPPMSPSANDRPSSLASGRTRLLEGRHYIDTSDQSETSSDMMAAAAGGTTTTDGGDDGMVAFVAADLNERIRLSSPTSSLDGSSRRSYGVGGGGSRRRPSTTTTSSSPSPYPPLLPDAGVLIDIETHARHLADSLQRIVAEFSGSLHGMTNLTDECMESYVASVSTTCDGVDGNIKLMYQMLAKSEELTQVLKPVPKLAQQIKEIKRILDLFESHMQKTVG